MMTQNSSQSRIIAVWLVLLAFLCVMIVPSMALAKEEMVIGTEGDPTDGLGATGGGSGNVDEEDNNFSGLLPIGTGEWVVLTFYFGNPDGSPTFILLSSDQMNWFDYSRHYFGKIGFRMGAKH